MATRIPDIANIAVYDPRAEGMDRASYLQAIVERDSFEVWKPLADKVSASEVCQGLSLDDYLYGPNGYFSQHSAVTSVIFVNGGFHSKYLGWRNIPMDSELEAIAADTGGIPFGYSRPIEITS